MENSSSGLKEKIIYLLSFEFQKPRVTELFSSISKLDLAPIYHCRLLNLIRFIL